MSGFMLCDDLMELIGKEVQKQQKIRLDKFWEEWADSYEDDLEDWFYDELISSQYWEDLELAEKLKIEKHHERCVEFHNSVMCDGAPPDWYWE